MRTLLALALMVAGLSATATTAAAAKWPAEYELPAGSQPEGIAAGKGREFFVGSIATGGVYRFDAKTGERTDAVPGGQGRVAIGIEYDRTTDRLFVAGGPTGKAFVYDAGTGKLLSEFELTAPNATGGTFINDVVVTKQGAYFTDSRQPTIYLVDDELTSATPIPLQGFTLVPGFNLNGIEASPNGKWLLAVQSMTGTLWRIDAATGQATTVDLGGYTLTNGDGLLFLSAKKLVAVQNQLDKAVVLKLSRSYTRGRVTRTYTHERFDVPTTVAKVGSSLFFVNARFGRVPDPTTAEYWVTRLKR
jgi:sugar lactone lactonase YvrE